MIEAIWKFRSFLTFIVRIYVQSFGYYLLKIQTGDLEVLVEYLEFLAFLVKTTLTLLALNSKGDEDL